MSAQDKSSNKNSSLIPAIDFIVDHAWGFAEPIFKLTAWFIILASMFRLAEYDESLSLLALATFLALTWFAATFTKCVHLFDYLIDSLMKWPLLNGGVGSKSVSKSVFLNIVRLIVGICITLFIIKLMSHIFEVAMLALSAYLLNS